MSDRPIEPLRPDLRALLDSERAPPEPPEPGAAARARVFGRVAGTLGLTPPVSAVSVATPAAASSWKLGALAATALALAGGGYLALGRAPAAQPSAPSAPAVAPPLPSTTPPPPVSSPAPAVAPPSPAAPGLGAAAPAAVHPAPLAPIRPTSRRPAVADTLAAERALLDEARARLRQGDGPAALARLDVHARSFPAGQLGEERDSLRVRALVTTGDREAARREAARFRLAHPASIFLPTVDAALAE